MSEWKWNPKLRDSGMISCIPQSRPCPNECADCFFQSGRSYLEPLEENLPHVPTREMAHGRVVCMNDGNDSNVDRDIVIPVAACYEDVFFNTSIPQFDFPGPVVLTINPGRHTDEEFRVGRVHEYTMQGVVIPQNLMFVRVRTNTWNLDTVEEAVRFYTSLLPKPVPVVLTFMAYYETPIPKQERVHYEWRERMLNSYWAIKNTSWRMIMQRFADNPLVYSCGHEGISTLCKHCGNCLREYHATKERLRTKREEKRT